VRALKGEAAWEGTSGMDRFGAKKRGVYTKKTRKTKGRKINREKEKVTK